MHRQRWHPVPVDSISGVVNLWRGVTYDDGEFVEVFYLAVSFPCLQDVIAKLRHPYFLAVFQIRRLQTQILFRQRILIRKGVVINYGGRTMLRARSSWRVPP